MQIEYIKVENLIPYSNNPRHNDGMAIDYVAASIKEFGFKNPIIVDNNNIVVCGDTRLKAAKKLELKEVPVIRAADLTPVQIKAFRIADNKVAEYATWDNELLTLELEELKELDFDIELTGFELEEINFLSEDVFEPINDENNENTVTFEHKLKCGKIEIVLTKEEFEDFVNCYNEYTSENGVSFGFVRYLLNG